MNDRAEIRELENSWINRHGFVLIVGASGTTIVAALIWLIWFMFH